MGFFSALGIGGNGGAGDTLDQITQDMQGLNPPTAQELSYRIGNLVQQGTLDPQQAQAFLVKQSAYSGIQDDPATRDAQMEAISKLGDISESGQLSQTDRAKLAQITAANEAQERGDRGAIQQHEAEIGRSGSGMEYADMLANEQGAAGRASQAGTDVGAQAEQEALQAMTQGASLGGQVRGQDFGQAAEKAAAADSIAKFNAQNLQSTNAANTTTNNAAAAANLAEKQKVADTNVQTAGQNQQIAANATEQSYQDQLAKKKAIADALTAKANLQQQAAAQKAAFTGSVIGAAGTVGAGAAMKSDERAKNIEGKEPDLDSFMESLRPIAFDYKSGGTGEGEEPGRHIGVRAQDVEKTPEGKTMVKNTPHGKMLDMAKAFGLILGSLAELKDEIDEKAA